MRNIAAHNLDLLDMTLHRPELKVFRPLPQYPDLILMSHHLNQSMYLKLLINQLHSVSVLSQALVKGSSPESSVSISSQSCTASLERLCGYRLVYLIKMRRRSSRCHASSCTWSEKALH